MTITLFDLLVFSVLLGVVVGVSIILAYIISIVIYGVLVCFTLIYSLFCGIDEDHDDKKKHFNDQYCERLRINDMSRYNVHRFRGEMFGIGDPKTPYEWQFATHNGTAYATARPVNQEQDDSDT